MPDPGSLRWAAGRPQDDAQHQGRRPKQTSSSQTLHLALLSVITGKPAVIDGVNFKGLDPGISSAGPY